MPNLISAKKRMRQNVVRHDRNQQVRTRIKTARREMFEALEAKNTEAGETALRSYSSVLDKAAKAGVIKKNTAIRRKTNAANGLRKIA
ncbi:30S ribosomal protein S20 [Pontiella sulfatireligans]|uniref:Small ribosomal subunit protein bS20 n=1 Tax=Pontiella sulfatireligans TaxID=2750658 RepID=A0A6C2UIL9_9BACT|nr:30S ribosomal protein S20 [Pontiella sulfatireligans]VGO20050.1 30S ribosomal protein S20 [Pontiella sulfatireligans]